MSVIVHKNEPIDDALRRLHAETIRENIFNVVNERRYHIKPSVKRSIIKREWKKRKTRGHRAKRKMRGKGI